jgi:murein DD-endopeptidase MepM/ murein hydrolase activator NlpD
VAYAPPVDAPVADPFRAPEHPYGPGNRGLEYDTRGGEVVRAAAAGEVTFAGLVAGGRYVTVLHADRLRTTYGRLEAMEVDVGAPVDAGEAVGRAGPAFIWTARLGDAYLDPAVLLDASGARRAWLVADAAAP